MESMGMCVRDVVNAAFTEAWLKIEELVGDSLKLGWEHTKERVGSVAGYVTDASVRLGNKAVEFQERLLKQPRLLISETFDLIFSSMRSEIKIGDLSYRLVLVELQQKLVFSGSIEASLTALCKFVGSGEFVVTWRRCCPLQTSNELCRILQSMSTSRFHQTHHYTKR
jgi:hypothetical protein